MEYETFKSAGMVGGKAPRGYQQIRLCIVFDVKHDLRHKARLIASGHMTEVPKDSTYLLVASLRSIRIVTFIPELNQLDLCVQEILEMLTASIHKRESVLHCWTRVFRVWTTRTPSNYSCEGFAWTKVVRGTLS